MRNFWISLPSIPPASSATLSTATRSAPKLWAVSMTLSGHHHQASSAVTLVYAILMLCMRAKSPIGRSITWRLTVLLIYSLLVSLNSFRSCMAAFVSSHPRSGCHSLASSSGTVSLIPWVQLGVFLVTFPSIIESTSSCPKIRWKGEYPALCLMVILSGQGSAWRWSIHISFSLSK